MKKYLLVLIIYTAFSVICCGFLRAEEYKSAANGQDSLISGQKKVLDHSVYDLWKRIDRNRIANDGKWTLYEINPAKGDGKLFLQNLDNGKTSVYERGYDAVFSPNSDYIAFRIKPQEDTVRKLKTAKKKKELFPKDTLAIKLLYGKKEFKDSLLLIPKLKSFSVTEDGKGWIGYLTERDKDSKDTASKNDVSVYDLTIFDPVRNSEMKFEKVTEFTFSKDGKKAGIITLRKGADDTAAVIIADLETAKSTAVLETRGFIKNFAFDRSGSLSTFIHTRDTSDIKRYTLYYSGNTAKTVRKIADTLTSGIPYEWEINPNQKLYFSDDGSRIYFGTSPKVKPVPVDSLLEEEKYSVDVWHWDDPLLQTQQLHNLESDKKKSYLAVYSIGGSKIVQLEDEMTDDVRTALKGNSDYSIGISTAPYRKSSSWIVPVYKDIYLINNSTGERLPVAEKVQYDSYISPGGNYIIWFDNLDTSWHSYSVKNGTKAALTENGKARFYLEDFDKPNAPSPYGLMGWTRDDEYVLIYDKYDIWKINPLNPSESIRLTKGRESNTIFRHIKTEPDSIFIELYTPELLNSQNQDNWREGFCRITIGGSTEPQLLAEFDNMLLGVLKSKKSDKVIFRKSAYNEYPDLWISTDEFTSYRKITDANPQKNDYLWGTVELISWKDFDGAEQKGLLYKPENFDPSVKYPVIAYFYEKYTDNYHAHYVPNPSRSVINFPLYNSSGYIIFIPDISYKTGYPGRSAYNAILSGAQYLADNFSFIDRDNFALQGQSWGGYQVAYLVTQTDFFKAAMSGAPVSNMTSAYGGIRWESGMNRIFQYEREQSRIGGTLWDSFNLYYENSPLFFADKVTTPLLIMANDGDGAVPWQQGIEFFVSLRRLGKKAWMLNYNKDAHNLLRWPNRIDLSIRMKQFFDHYLKNEPMPEWMKEGIPALQKGIKSGYELIK